jgi:hypothetical protein
VSFLAIFFERDDADAPHVMVELLVEAHGGWLDVLDP